MSNIAGVFSAWFLNEQGSQPYVFTFFSRDAADTWWRALKQLQAEEQLHDVWDIRRHNAQSYCITGDGTKFWALVPPHFIIHICAISPQQPPPILPASPRIDYVNGRTYHIRSVAHPRVFWHYNTTHGTIEGSDDHHTLFVIQRSKSLSYDIPKDRLDEDILIGTDEVNIFVADPRRKDGRGVMITRVNYSGGSEQPWFRLETNSTPDDALTPGFLFQKFKGGFYRFSGDRDIHETAMHLGEYWELV